MTSSFNLQIVNIFGIAFRINIITNDIFIILILYIIAELTELHELTLSACFLCLLIAKVHMRKQIILVDFSPPKTQTHLSKSKTNTNIPKFMKYFWKVVILESIKFRAWNVKLKTLYCILASLKLTTLSLVCDFQI